MKSPPAASDTSAPSPQREGGVDGLQRRRLIVALAVLAVLAAVVFAQCGSFEFLDYDDPVVVTENKVVQEGLGSQSLSFAFSDTRMNLYHPLTWLSHMMDVEVFGDWAGGHHLVNVLLHLANGILVFLLVAALGGRALFSFFMAALFLVHPLHVESVAWISERKDVLSTFFYLLTVLLYVRWTASRSWKLYTLAVMTCLLGFLAKPNLMTLPFALLLLDCWPLRRLDPGDLKRLPPQALKLALEKFPFFALAAVFMAIAWKIETSGAHEGVAELTTFAERLAFTGQSYGSWLLRTVWPAGLSTFYPHPEAGTTGMVILSWVVVILLSVFAVVWRKAAPWFFVGWFWFLLLLFPASGIITISDNFAPDRYTYLAHLGIFVVLGGGLWALAKRLALPSALPAALTMAALLVLTALATRQTARWKTSERLWRHCVAVTERNYFAHNKLAVILLTSDREEEAISHLEAAVAAQPDFAFAHANLGRVLTKRGDLEAAIGHFGQAIAVKPNDVAMRKAILPLLQQTSRPVPVVLPHLEALVRLSPRDPKARYDLATLWQGENQLEKALPHYLAAAELTPPSNYLVRGDLGATLVKMERYTEAIPYLEAAARHPENPFAPRASYLLGLAYHKLGQNEQAIPHLEAAVLADPSMTQAHRALERLREKLPSTRQK